MDYLFLLISFLFFRSVGRMQLRSNMLANCEIGKFMSRDCAKLRSLFRVTVTRISSPFTKVRLSFLRSYFILGQLHCWADAEVIVI